MSQETGVSIQHDPKPLLPVARVHARVHGGPGVRANEGLDKGEIWMNSYKFARNSYKFRANSYEYMPMDRLQACRVLPLFVFGTVWAWWMRLGRDFHWMMDNEAGA